MRRLPKLAAVVLTTLLVAGACSDVSERMGPEGPGSGDPSFSISDAVHESGNEHFYWLPPMVKNPNPTGAFDETQSPTVTICQLDGGACAAVQPAGFPLVYTDATGPGGDVITVSAADEHYHVNWHTDVEPLDTSELYRIEVSVGSQTLGHADVDPVSTGKELKNVDTDEYIALKDGRTLPIKFRIEEGALDTACAGSGMVACWTFDEGTGQVAADGSGNGNDGRLGGSTGPDARDPAWIAGKVGGALNFNTGGGADYIYVPNDASLEPTHITLEMWVRAPSHPGSFSYALAKGGNACIHAGYEMFTFATGGLFFGFTSASATTNVSNDTGAGIWDGQWHHLAGTYDEQFQRVYVDGVEVGSGIPLTEAIGYGLPTHNDLYIGAYVGGCTLAFTGDLDEVAIWDRALTPAEVAQRAAR